jgi:hypothetical protein
MTTQGIAERMKTHPSKLPAEKTTEVARSPERHPWSDNQLNAWQGRPVETTRMSGSSRRTMRRKCKEERQRLLRPHNNTSRKENDTLRRRRCWTSTELGRLSPELHLSKMTIIPQAHDRRHQRHEPPQNPTTMV